MSAASTAALLTGCATNPVSGKRQLMFMSEASEFETDHLWAPHQFSADYGKIQDDNLNTYISNLGNEIAAKTHRPAMPYNFRALNAVCINAYTFPAGSVGVARGLLLALQNEAQLTAVLSHEMGHVNARHAGQQMTKNILIALGTAGAVLWMEHENKKYSSLAAGLGMIGGNMLLCRYSRKNERQADSLGMEYMTRTGHNPRGMADVMELFTKLHKSKPTMVDLLFATHPMSEERYENALEELRTTYANTNSRSMNTERYMDHTAHLRAIAPAINEMQNGQEAMMAQKLDNANSSFAAALKHAPSDYAALLMMAKCLIAQQQPKDALRYAEEARAVYPLEPQAIHITGLTKMNNNMFESALTDFTLYEEMLPGNPNTIFYNGMCNEKMSRKNDAASQYLRYIKEAPDGEFTPYTRTRLVEWGYLNPPQQTQESGTKKK